ncbi:Transcription factor castor, partial [Pseudolycoriella hygida]
LTSINKNKKKSFLNFLLFNKSTNEINVVDIEMVAIMKSATTSSQSPTPQSVGTSIVQIPSAAAVVLHNQQTKNKRKNFNPRCSTSADENDMNSSTTVDSMLTVTTASNDPDPSSPTPSNPPPNLHQNASPTPTAIRNSPFKFDGDPRIAFEAMSINWRKLLESQQANQSNEFRDFENNKFYNIPNTNFSIAKSAFGIAAAAAAAQQQTLAMSQNEASDPQSRIEFACNAFNVMQELVKAYGPFISPTDIVDAFKKQAAVESTSLEPPTPPRTPIIASQFDVSRPTSCNATTLNDGGITRPQAHEQNAYKSPRSVNNDADESVNTTSRPSSPWSNVSQAAASTSISVAPPSKLMGNDNFNADRLSRTSSTNDTTARDDHSDGEQEDDEEDNSSATHAFDLSYQYNEESNGSGSGDDQGSEGGTTTNSFELAMARKDSFTDRSNDIFFSPLLQQTLQNEEKLFNADGSKYFKKYSSFLDCNNEQCIAENIREHYHCYDIACLGKVLSKKEEISRHHKWHKKRNDSLNHGFLRFSSSDDCAPQFVNCSHNRKQTHYHCLQPNCDKVYISTSDVQMHSNYHRKDSAIYQEGFQRFRGTEECNVVHCTFKGQRTTHFHCRRKDCKYTFKNKADMEKHKTFHIKDEQLARDGFKKFLKTEACPYDKCRFSRSGNHIHCVRENCYYVLHSSGQLISHKRKHDRMESEQAYRRFKIAQKMATNSALTVGGTGVSGGIVSPDLKFPLATKLPSDYKSLLPGDLSVSLSSNKLAGVDGHSKDVEKPTLPVDILQQIHLQQQQVHQQNMMLQMMGLDNSRDVRGTPMDRITNLPGRQSTDSLEEGIPKSIIPNADFLDMKTSSVEQIEYLTQTYFTDVCSMQNDSRAASPLNGPQDRPLNLKSPKKSEVLECFMTISEPHLHCLIKGCEMVISKNNGDVAEHMRMHELARMGGATEEMLQIAPSVQITSIDGLFNRKRGRPPKNRVVEVYNNIQQSPQAIFTSFKLEKNEQSPLHSASQSKSINNDHQTTSGKSFRFFHRMERCEAAVQCPYDKLLHFHCAVTDRCHFATNFPNVMDSHVDEFHSNGATVPDGFEYFDVNFDCQMYRCSYRKNSSHYHCINCKETIKKIMDLANHECRSVINVQSNNFAQITDLKIMQNNNNENVNGDSGVHASKSASCDYDDGENMDTCAGEMSGNLTDSCGSEKMNSSEIKIAAQTDDKDKVSVVRAAGTYFPQNSDNEQAFSDAMKLKIHYLKHQSSKLGHSIETVENSKTLSMSKEDPTTPEPLKLLGKDSEPEDLTKSSSHKAPPSNQSN